MSKSDNVFFKKETFPKGRDANIFLSFWVARLQTAAD